jgi:hypothetical protein
MQVKEVQIQEKRRKKTSICPLAARIACETLCVLLIFVPLFLFLFAWPNAKTAIHGKVLSVRSFSMTE